MTRMATDHFTPVAAQYAQSRPTYPDALFDWLLGISPGRALCWAVGAGNGQASVALAQRFEHVRATDLSAAQIAEAAPHERIAYAAAPADESGLPDGSADLVTVAQALHWFDLDPFYAEVKRVLKPGGVFAAWSYGVLHVEGDAADALLQHFYWNVVGPHWPAERRHVENGYAQLAFPFHAIEAPPLAITLHWTLDELLGYVRSWSATSRMQRATGSDPVSALESQLAPAWGARDARRLISWPIAMRAGRL